MIIEWSPIASCFGPELAFGPAMAANSKANELERRLILFATNIVKLSGQLRDNSQATHIARQVLRSGTAAAPNHAEARSAESRPDFIHKLKIALKELNETSTWLRIIQGSFEVNSDFLSRLIAENQELCKIVLASIQTARRNSQ
jgi:four helix bundle protein